MASSEQKLPEKISNQWYAELLLGMTDGLMDFFGHRQVKSKQKIVPLPAPLPQEIDEEAKAVPHQVLSDGYSASEPLDVEGAEGRQDPIEVQAWENSALIQKANSELLVQVWPSHQE